MLIALTSKAALQKKGKSNNHSIINLNILQPNYYSEESS